MADEETNQDRVTPPTTTIPSRRGQEPDMAEEPDAMVAPSRPSPPPRRSAAPAPDDALAPPSRPTRRRNNDATAKNRARQTARATVPGAVAAVVEEPSIVAPNGEIPPASIPASAPAPARTETATEAADRRAKQRGRRTARAATTTVGAVSVAAGEDTSGPMEPSAAAMTTGSKSNAAGGTDAGLAAVAAQARRSKKSGSNKKKRRSKAAATPGIVHITGSDEDNQNQNQKEVFVDEEQPSRGMVSTTTASTAVASYDMSKPARVSTDRTTVPGAMTIDDSRDGTTQYDVEKKDIEEANGNTDRPGARSIRGVDTDTDEKGTSRGVSGTTSGDVYMRRMEEKVKAMENEHGMAPKEEPVEEPPAAPVGIIVGEDLKKDWGADEEDPEEAHVTPEEEVAPIMTADAGMAGMPELEYGTMGGPTGYAGYDDDENLAVAMAIEEEEELFLPAAVQYDPDAKPPLHKNRRFRLYFVAGILLLIVTCVGVGVAIVATSGPAGVITQPPTSTPTSSPTNLLEQQYRLQVAASFPESNDPTSMYDRAARWIMFEDPRQVATNDPTLLQRYTAALFWFVTTNDGEAPWRSCNKPVEGGADDCQYERFTRANDDSIVYVKEDGKRWLSGVGECEWTGVLCDEAGIVQAIELQGQNITGTLPEFLGSFEFLRSIHLSYNEFVGTLPEAYADIRHLINLEVHGNMLTGTISPKFWDAKGIKKSTLQNFNVGDNLLTGTLSTEVGLLTDLKGLHVFQNFLDGPFPTEVGRLRDLSYFRGSNNAFSGQIPSEFGELGILREFWMHGNALNGTIPSELGLMTDLNAFRISENKIGGSIPETLFNMLFLTRFVVNSNELTGTLSTRIGSLASLELLRVSRNRLVGTIPTEITQLPALKLGWFHLNQMTGSMPAAVCNNVGPGLLSVLQTDCHPEGNPDMECACCTSCCDRSTEICLQVREV